jgi:hypothetical protein
VKDFVFFFPEFPAIGGALQEVQKVTEEIRDQPLTLDTADRMLAAVAGVLRAIDESDAAMSMPQRAVFAAMRAKYVGTKQSVERMRDDLIERATENKPPGKA